jgi:quercetin dioxygenase-like cupin family protein
MHLMSEKSRDRVGVMLLEHPQTLSPCRVHPRRTGRTGKNTGREREPAGSPHPDPAIRRLPNWPRLRQLDEERSVPMVGGAPCTVKVRETDGGLGLFEYVMAPGTSGPGPHSHRGLEEIFHVIEGQVELLLGGGRLRASAGTSGRIPTGTVHGFSNPGPGRSVLLVAFYSAEAHEAYIKDDHRAAGREERSFPEEAV